MSAPSLNLLPLDFAGEQFQVVGNAALWWPAQRALLVADLHFEKASWFARFGQMLPPYDSHATLTRLSALAAGVGAAHIYCLGDNFHDDAGAKRLPPELRAQLEALVNDHGLHWIVGNHDPQLGGAVPGAVSTEVVIGNITLRHEAQAHFSGGEISGHYHPKARIKTVSRTVSRPCFLAGEWTGGDGALRSRLILPAFGALTGGLDSSSEVLAALFPSPYRSLVPTRGQLLSFANFCDA